MLIDQRDPDLMVTISTLVKGKSRKLQLSYETTGKTTRYTGLDGDSFQSSATWHGNNLVFDILELEDGKQIRWQELWGLEENGGKLSITKSKSGQDQASACTSLFVNKKATS